MVSWLAAIRLGVQVWNLNLQKPKRILAHDYDFNDYLCYAEYLLHVIHDVLISRVKVKPTLINSVRLRFMHG